MQECLYTDFGDIFATYFSFTCIPLFQAQGAVTARLIYQPAGTHNGVRVSAGSYRCFTLSTPVNDRMDFRVALRASDIDLCDQYDMRLYGYRNFQNLRVRILTGDA